MTLYEQYLEMNKVAEAAVVTNQEEERRVQLILTKTAEAETLIKEAGITECSTEDVADVVTVLINNEIEAEESREKIAQLHDMGRIMFQGFDAEMREATAARAAK